MDCKRILNKIALIWLISTASLAHAKSVSPCVNWPKSDFQPIANKQTGIVAPDYGLYWFKMSKGQYPEAVKKAYTPASLEPYYADGSRNTNPGPRQPIRYQLAKAAYQQELLKTNYFDPTKPTVIFIHGWNPDSTINKKRFDLCYQYQTGPGKYSPRYNTLKYFKEKGWNVGIFYWNQFSDDEDLYRVENKIYPSIDPTPRSWAYLNADNQLEYCANSLNKTCMALPKNANNEPDSMARLAFNAYTDALPANYHQTIHIVGFSLGTQIAIQLADSILETPTVPQASRLTLLDPYLTNSKLSGSSINILALNIAALNNIINIASKQHKDFVISLYRTSLLSNTAYQKMIVGNPNIAQHIAYVKLEPKYLNPFYQQDILEAQHVSAPYLYFQSMRAAPNDHCNQAGCSSSSYIDAASSNAEIKALAGQKRYQKPDALLPEKDTSEHDFPDTQDDVFSANPL